MEITFNKFLKLMISKAFIYKPVISLPETTEFAESLICISNTFLGYSVTENYYHLFKTQLGNTKARGKKKSQPRLSLFWGTAFQQYADELLKTVFSEWYYSEFNNSLVRKIGCDGLLVSDSYVFVIEAKSKRLTHGEFIIKTKQDFDTFTKEFITNDESPKGGLEQLFGYVSKAVAEAEFKNKQIIPVFLTSESMPSDFELRSYYNKALGVKKIDSIRVLPYILLDIHDLEILRISLKQDRNYILSLLVKYSQEQDMSQKNYSKVGPLINFLNARGEIYEDKLASLLIAEIDEVHKRMEMRMSQKTSSS